MPVRKPRKPQALELSQAVCAALFTHPQTRIAAAQLTRAQAQQAQAQAALGPTVQASVASNASQGSGVSGTLTNQAELRITQVLFDAGLREQEARAREAEAVASVLAAEASAQSVMLEAARRYFALAQAERAHESAIAQQAAARQSLDAAQARMQAGVAVRLEVRQAEAAWAQAQLELAQSTRDRMLARAELAQYTGLALTENQSVLLEAAEAAPVPELAPLLAQARAQRPELRAAQKRAQAADARSTAAAHAMRPQVSASASLGWTDAPGRPAQSAAVGLQVSIPLYDGGLLQARRTAAYADQAQARAELEALTRDIEQAVLQAHARLVAAGPLLAAARAYLDAALETQSHAAGRYRAGVGTLADWLDAQAAVAQARSRLASAQAESQLSRLQLAQALGRLSPHAL